MKNTIAIVIIILSLSACSLEPVTNSKFSDSDAPIFPDFNGVTIPLNICPLNFDATDDNAELIDIQFVGNITGTIHCQNSGTIDIPRKSWRELLLQNAGDTINVTVSTKKNGSWTTFRPFPIIVSTDSIDQFVVYRLIAPAFETFSHTGIYQRNIENFDETTIVDNHLLQMACINCHSFNRNDPHDFIFHVRGPHGGTFVRKNDGPLSYYNTKTNQTLNNFAYAYWHPDSRYVAFSMNTTRQLFHSGTGERIDVFDGASDICVFDTETDQILHAPHLRTKDFENWPTFSPDGTKIYFTLADSVPMPMEHKTIRCVICSVDFDAENGIIGQKIDTLVNLRNDSLSASVPRPSYDGKYLMFSSLTFGNFPVWHEASDLWLHNLSTGETYPLTEANSETCEAYHNWSTNSRWFCVSSRRIDNLHTLIYFGRIDENGHSSKPFLLPQRSPKEYYRNQLRSFSCPEFSTREVEIDDHSAWQQFSSDRRRSVTLQ